MADTNRYGKIIERIFLANYKDGAEEVTFKREDIAKVATELKIELPKNIGDIIYTFRYRNDLPKAVMARAPKHKSWIIRPAGRGLYKFVATTLTSIIPNKLMAQTKVPDATPGIIEMYALTDEQALLAKLRYNKLIDIFTGVTCYPLQSHLRTSVPGMGQVETDELYVGMNRHGAHFVLPVQAKGGNDKLSVVQIEQDVGLCAAKFPTLICRPIAAQFVEEGLIALFEFEEGPQGVRLLTESHYKLVLPEELSPEELRSYRDRGATPP
jgi:hypothetical protein